MRRFFLLGALLVVLVANGWGVWQAKQNKTESRGGTLQLTERELALEPVVLESSVTVLRLNWVTRRTGNQRFGPAAWLDGGKLAELGFDCSVPLNSDRARRHYGSMPPRRVFLALEYQHDATAQGTEKDQARSGLVVVDAAQNPDRLRERYPDPAKHGICRGSVRLGLSSRDADGGRLSAPRLEGWVEELLPGHVSVPRPTNRLLAQFLKDVSEAENAPSRAPRFSARVSWGKNYEPWVDNIRPLSVSPTSR